MRLRVGYNGLMLGLPPAPVDGGHSIGFFQEPSNRLPAVPAYQALRRSICTDLYGNRLVRGAADVVCIPTSERPV